MELTLPGDVNGASPGICQKDLLNILLAISE
jgi:hypothetical protein